jgi:hypothetical protein
MGMAGGAIKNFRGSLPEETKEKIVALTVEKKPDRLIFIRSLKQTQ